MDTPWKSSKLRLFALAALCSVSILPLAACARLTSVEAQSPPGNYAVNVTIDPVTLNPPQTGSISYGVTDTGKNKPVSAFVPVYSALLHNILISRDLQYFYHSYTTELIDNRASVFTYFPGIGRYYNFALFQPQGAALQIYSTTITTGEAQGNAPSLVEDPSPSKTQGWLNFTLNKSTNEIKAGQSTQLAFTVRQLGNPVTALWPYMGAPGHMWVIDEAGGAFAHEVGSSQSHVLPTTPGPDVTGTPVTSGMVSGVSSGSVGSNAAGSGMGRQPVPQEFATTPLPTLQANLQSQLNTVASATAYPLAPVQQTPQSFVNATPEILPDISFGPDVVFAHSFPHPGMYRVWVEVQYRGQVVTVPYNIRVVP